MQSCDWTSYGKEGFLSITKESLMVGIIYKFFEITFRLVGILLLTGLLVSVLLDLQKKAFNSKSVGLTSMLKINEQLVGKVR